MPKQVTKGLLAKKLGAKLKQAVDAHREDETKFDSGGRLPAGIEGGIAVIEIGHQHLDDDTGTALPQRLDGVPEMAGSSE